MDQPSDTPENASGTKHNEQFPLDTVASESSSEPATSQSHAHRPARATQRGQASRNPETIKFRHARAARKKNMSLYGIATDHRPEYTGVRALALSMVVVSHVCYWTGKIDNSPLGRIISRWEVCVPLFCGLSGFLLTISWIKQAQDRSLPHQIWRYICHRFWRIIPAYYIALLVCFLVSRWFVSNNGHGASAHSFLRYLWFGQIFRPSTQLHGLTHIWSLSEEWYWYGVFPWIIIGVMWLLRHHLSSIAWIVPVLCCVISVCIFSWQVKVSSNPFTYNAIFFPWGFLGWFFAGMIIALIPRTAIKLPLLAWIVLIVCLVIAPWHIFGNNTIVDFQHPPYAVAKYVLYMITEAAFLYLVSIKQVGILAHKPIVWLGEYSYEIFLLHVPIIELVMYFTHWQVFTGNTILLLLLVLAITIPIARAFYPVHRYIHTLCSAWGQKIVRALSRSS